MIRLAQGVAIVLVFALFVGSTTIVQAEQGEIELEVTPPDESVVEGESITYEFEITNRRDLEVTLSSFIEVKDTSESIGDGREIAKSEEVTIGVGESYVLEGEITSEDTEELESGDYQVVGYITTNRDLYDDVKTDLTIQKAPKIEKVEHEPDVAEEGEEVDIKIDVEDTSVVDTVSISYNSESDSGTLDEFDISEIVGSDFDYEGTIPTQGIGEETSYTVSVTKETSDGDSIQDSMSDSYLTFKNVEDIAALYGKYYEDGLDNEVGDDSDMYKPTATGEDLEERQDNLQKDINRYMASWKESWGGVGYNFDFYDNENNWYTLGDDIYENVADYSSGDQNSGPNYKSDFFNEVSGDGYDIDDYLATVYVHPGEENFIGSQGEPEYTRADSSIIVHENVASKTSVWLHELGHGIGHFDLYRSARSARTTGSVGYTGLMGRGSELIDTSPFSAVSKTSLHNIRWDNDPTVEREDWPWAELNPVTITEDQPWQALVDLLPLEEKQYNSAEIRKYESPIDSDITYVLAARDTTIETERTDTEGGSNSPITVGNGVYIYMQLKVMVLTTLYN